MKAIVIDNPNSIEIREVPMPEVKEGEALLKVKYVGICGADLASYTGNQPFTTYPRIPGHEFSAEIVEIPENDKGFKKGDIVKPVRGLYTRPSYCGGTFVLTSMEKTVYGFAFDAAGTAFHGCISDYLDLEYDNSMLVNEERALATISKYLKGEVDLVALLNEYHYVLSINAANRIRLLTNRT